MQWIIRYLTSSIGKKQIMGCTGAALALFILGHMVGNLQLLNPDPVAAQASFNQYSYFLTHMTPFIYFIELGLIAIFLVHLFLAITLKIENRKARGPETYEVNARKGSKTFASFTMIWSGIFVLGFLVSHLYMLKFGSYYAYQNPDIADGAVVRDMWLTTILMFANPAWAAFYTVGMVIVGLHLFHAISSAFQTLGIAHQKWTPIIDFCGKAYAVVVGGGFLVIAIASSVMAHNQTTQNLINDSLRLQDSLKQQEEQAQPKATVASASLSGEAQVSYVMKQEGDR